MKAEPLVKEIIINAPVKKVWSAITSKEEMAKWSFHMPEFKAEAGFEFTFAVENKGKNFVHMCKVTEAEPNKKLVYSWRYDGAPGDSLVTWELFPDGAKTKLKLTHTGLETFPQDTQDYKKENFDAGWTWIFNSVKENAEKSGD